MLWLPLLLLWQLLPRWLLFPSFPFPSFPFPFKKSL
jgi:hypothetical protein